MSAALNELENRARSGVEGTSQPASRSAARNGRRAGLDGPHPNRAVIDIGSNTVRLVIYSGSPRAPDVWLNEKVTARLGRELASTGRMPAKAIDLALAGLARFAAMLEDIGVPEVSTVATAAVRDAANGAAFLERVRALGLEPRLLSGEEEARISAMGVVGAFPRARGVVADLGGGSLELVAVENGSCHHGSSLPLGTLRLPALRAAGNVAFRKAVAAELARTPWAKASPSPQPGPLYLVGGTWRALAAYAMDRSRHPITDPHGLVIAVDEADRLARKLMRTPAPALAAIGGISAARAASLPDAAALLRLILAEVAPESLAFSSWGLREGVLFEQLPLALREQDPLLAGIATFGAPRGASPAMAAMVAGWTSGAASGSGVDGGRGGAERLRLAATMLALAAVHLEPNMRLRHATDWALDKRWVAIDHRGRAIVAAAVRAACGRPEPLPELIELAGEAALREAAGWGLAIRLCRRIGAGSRMSLLTSSLTRQDGRLVLWLEASRAQLASDPVLADLRALAGWLGVEHDLRFAVHGTPPGA